MAENPLLPHRRLQELHALMLRCRELDRQHRQFPGLAREAILAAATIQMEPGDLLCGEDGDSVSASLVPGTGTKSSKKAVANLVGVGASTADISRLVLAAGMAKVQQAAGNKGVVVALASAGSRETDWEEGLTYAQKARLPLMLLCVDSGPSRRTGSGALTEAAVNKLSKKLFLPTLTVDGEDAVAVYRVMQESYLRARMGDGPAVIWCLLPKRASRGVSRPVANMERYLAARGLKARKRP